jgi:hypothetical protein
MFAILVKLGDRVQLHPATNWWMRGAKFGTVTKIGRKRVWVKLDATGRTVPIALHNLLEVVS